MSVSRFRLNFRKCNSCPPPNAWDFADPKCSHAPSILSQRSSALGSGRGDRPQGATAEGQGAGASKHLECCLLPMSKLICDKER
jgi:hypothetical protein